MACSVKARISLMARGARFLKETPCTFKKKRELEFSLPSKMPFFFFFLQEMNNEKSFFSEGLLHCGQAIEVDFIKLILCVFFALSLCSLSCSCLQYLRRPAKE